MTKKPGLLATGHQLGVGGAWAKLATLAPAAIMSRTRSSTSATSVRRLTPEGPVGPFPHLGQGGLQLGQGHGGRGQQAQPTGGGGGRHQPGSGHPAHAGLNDGIANADPGAEGVDQGRSRGRPVRRWAIRGRELGRRGPVVPVTPSRLHLLDAQAPLGSSTSRMRASSSGSGSRGGADVVADHQGEAGGRHHLVHRDPGMHRAQPHGAFGGFEVEDAQVGDHPSQVVEAGGPDGPAAAARAEAHAADHVDLLDEGPQAVVGAPSSWSGWLTELPGAPRTPTSCTLGLAQSARWPRGFLVAGPGSIWLAIIMMWRRPDQHHVEHLAAVGHGRLADQLIRTPGCPAAVPRA